MKTCYNCGVDLEGELIYNTFLHQGKSPEEALEIAKMYGATETEGKWGKEIAIYSLEEDKTIAYKCPVCNYQWERE